MKFLMQILFGFIYFASQSQNYFELSRFSYAISPPNNFEISDEKTTIQEFSMDLSFPVTINENTILLLGFNGNRTSLKLGPNEPRTNLNQLRLNAGINMDFNEKWSGTFFLLPKLVADQIRFSKENFQLGILSLFTKKKKENLKLKYGLYLNTEEFGLLVVPIWGLYYKSMDQKFEANLNLPIFADTNYIIGNSTWIGMNFNGLGTSYNLTWQNYTTSNAYVFKESNELSGYLRFKFSDFIFFNTAIGYAINRNYEIYDSNDKVNWTLTAFHFGDNRNRLNERFEDGIFFKMELVYRIYFD